MSLSIGIVGLPNVGKSTLFNALLKKQSSFAEASAGQVGSGGAARVGNFPFTTIEPNVGVVPVPDYRLERLAQIVQESDSHGLKPPIVPAVVQFVDIAGLVKGAAEGEGLGNKFLSHIREADAICQVVRYFKDSNVVRSDSSTDAHSTSHSTVSSDRIGSGRAKSDYEVVNTELILADLQTLENQKEPKKNPTKEDLLRWNASQKLKTALNQGKLAKDVELHEDEKEAAKSLQLLTMKPMFIVANVDEEALKENFPEDTIAVSAKIESELSELSEDEQKEYLKDLGIEESGLERIITEGYKILNLISFLTAPSSAKASEGQGGKWEVRAWTVRRGSTSLMASGTIHTDFMKKFIKAEVVSFEDFVQFNGWKGAREHGKDRLEGKEYIVKDGDVVEFKIGA